MSPAHTMPVFVFLSPIEKGQDAFVPAHTGPFLALLGIGGDHDGFVVTDQGVDRADGWVDESGWDEEDDGAQGGNGAEDDTDARASLHPVLDMVGASSLQSFMLGHHAARVAHHLGESSTAVLCCMVEDEGTIEAISESMPTADDVFGDGGIARTRDALFWTHSPMEGAQAPIEVDLYVDPLVGTVVPDEMAATLAHALAVAGVSLPGDVSYEDALDMFYVGCVDAPSTAHGKLGLHQRLVEDTRLFSHVMGQVEGSMRPLVPVLL